MTSRRQVVGDNDTPVRDQDKVMLRLPDGMREHLKGAAADNKRSMNAEIVARLEGYEAAQSAVEWWKKDYDRMRVERDKALAKAAAPPPDQAAEISRLRVKIGQMRGWFEGAYRGHFMVFQSWVIAAEKFLGKDNPDFNKEVVEAFKRLQQPDGMSDEEEARYREFFKRMPSLDDDEPQL